MRRGQGSVMLWVEGWRFKLLWSENGDGVGVVGVMVKEEVVEVRMVSERVMVVVLVFEEDVLRLIYVCAT